MVVLLSLILPTGWPIELFGRKDMRKKITTFFLGLMLCTGWVFAAGTGVVQVAAFKGIQVTGVTVTEKGRVFANFPRWRKGVPFSVVEVFPDGCYQPYPGRQANNWEVGQPLLTDQFVAVQSVVAQDNHLYVLDTMNTLWQGILADPKVYVFNLDTNLLVKTYTLSSVVRKNSYVNDLRVDTKKQKIYFTDSNAPGLIVLDMLSGDATRVLDNHPFTRAETDHLVIDGKRRRQVTHADGIALDRNNDILYFHALSGYTLYGISTQALISNSINEKEVFRIRTAAPDGMIMDAKGNLYFADLEHHKIQYLSPDRKEIRTLVEGKDVRWADTFSIHDGWLYYTNSRIHEANGDISDMVFTINKVRLPDQAK